ncbi:4-methyl-5(b-hydroxyethyl)-thiazole monophosphate biosynthesis [Saccharicrinis carchari]|uniref:4-methyl-5(B-hydroxyethyl)-thiazole monophosphate biosynthesis n=1 Tax=Saccharicrinis carchari TaxID=1168039 RepID=A0A521EDW4_SACCC|nr:DJ-1 family glyoxalase III [Saccharicrinis carchari]SMO81380.1 4-methyl-5(b-hydroxyethyl)-thiazole monophosphate biosynthesis [Saccharicrinis carchari]
MKRVFIFLAEGFEEIEAITPIDVLRRAQIDVTTVSISDKREVHGAHKIPIVADVVFADADFSGADLLVLPGGLPGSTNLNEHIALKELLVDFSNKGKLIGAICAAPLVLGGLGLLKDKTATCYPGVEGKLTGAKHTGAPLEVDGNIVTAKGIGAAMKFALQLVSMLKSKEEANRLAKEMVVE